MLHEGPGHEEALRAEGVDALYRIGDCVAPQLIADCSFDGRRLGRESDAEDPARPLPYRRERAPRAADPCGGRDLPPRSRSRGT